MAGENMSAPRMKLDGFDLEGLKAACRATVNGETCPGMVMIEREWLTFHLNPERIWCILCGQRYTIDTHGLVGWPLEEKLRLGDRKGRNHEG
jgi:hypothetical protein